MGVSITSETEQKKQRSPRQRRGIFAFVEALVAVVLCWPLALFPASWACFYARLLARPAWFLAHRRRRVTLSNLRYVYGDRWSEKKIRKVGLESWRRVALSAVVALQIRGWLQNPDFRQRIDWQGPWDELERRQKSGEGFLLVGGHLGPFEILLPALMQRGWRIGLLSRPIKNAYIHFCLDWVRRGNIPTILDPAGALPQMGKSLKEGTSIAMLVDQNQRKGIYVPFLGREAGSTPALGVLTRRYGVSVVYLAARRIKPGHGYRISCEIADLPWGDDVGSHVDQVTRCVSHRIETMVKEVPADWLWMHQRWKSRPDGSREVLREN